MFTIDFQIKIGCCFFISKNDIKNYFAGRGRIPIDIWRESAEAQIRAQVEIKQTICAFLPVREIKDPDSNPTWKIPGAQHIGYYYIN
jgi:hypothetical protein